jgi:phosphoribosylformylglycinamidine synthase
MIVKRFRRSILCQPEEQLLARRLRETAPEVEAVTFEHCFYVDVLKPLQPEQSAVLDWLLSETFEPGSYGHQSSLTGSVLEVGPRVEIVTPWSTNATKICHACGLDSVIRIERSRRYQIAAKAGAALSSERLEQLYPLLYDRMTEAPYVRPLTTFESDKRPDPVRPIPLIEEGPEALQRLGLAFDRPVLEHNYDYFTRVLRANPTDVVLTHLDQTQSDHSRHRRFNAVWRIDGVSQDETLMGMIKANHLRHPNHTLIAFEDNASVVRGHQTAVLASADPSGPSEMAVTTIDMEETAKGESHNHPTAIVSHAGAGTGTGGRIRDNQTVGRGGTPVAGSTLYLVGNLFIPGYALPWEEHNWQHPYQLETPLQIILGAPRGAYRYGNEFGEPTISGSTTSFEYVHSKQKEPEMFGYTKCGMWTVGLGWMDRRHLKKHAPERGLQIVQLGGDAYCIGLGGASGSSKTAGAQEAELDWNSVQRANAEMEKVFDRVIQACIMMGNRNPIRSIHDLGAGGDSNAVTELVFPAGGRVHLRRIPSGDKTMSVLELWCNESQERIVLLAGKEDLPLLQKIAAREKCPLAVIGEITGDGRLVVIDEAAPPEAPSYQKEPVDLDLGFALGKLPQLVLDDRDIRRRLEPVKLPQALTVRDALDRVLRLLKVCSKSFLVNHVDRSVTGLVAQQQCSGALQLPVADVAVTADGYFGTTGRCWGIGDQPVKWIISSEASVRLAVAEALTNLVWAPVEGFESISVLANWGIAASEPGEGANLYRAVTALNALLDDLGISINGGKDSMSMAARVDREGEKCLVKAPGTLVVTAYAACTDITRTVTPDIKQPGASRLMFIDLSGGRGRIGGSALSQVFSQMGHDAPDVDHPKLLRAGFEAVQSLIREGLILAGHDRSDGGLMTCLLEMAFAGDCGLDIRLEDGQLAGSDALHYLFNEEPGLAIEYLPRDEPAMRRIFKEHGIEAHCHSIGNTSADRKITVRCGGQSVLTEDMPALRDVWQETSFHLERLQSHPDCAAAERRAMQSGSGLRPHLSFEPTLTPDSILSARDQPRVAILREEGTNGDREMAAAFFLAGFEPWDVTMTDLAEGRIGLEGFRGVAFCGGFSYGDVLDAGKGWAGVIRFNPRIRQEFDSFYSRRDTFSLGVCNGCQVMAILGWVPWQGIEAVRQPRFVANQSAMFESRFVAVKVLPGPSILLRGMEDSILGVWLAHGEGRFICTDDSLVREIRERRLAPLRFVDAGGSITEQYPANPNGSALGITALCSADGRHLALMPHPERVFLPWQWPCWPKEWAGIEASPWLRLFQNARTWCDASH